MRLAITHRTRYRFAQPARRVVQSLRLWPSTHDGQRVVSWHVHADRATIDAGYRDASGGRVQTLSAQGPVEAIEVLAQGVVEVGDRHGIVRGTGETMPALAYLRAGPYTAPTAVIAALASRARAAAAPPLELAHRLSAAVADALRYAPGTTHAHTTAAEALADGVGVCQDLAQVLVAAARTLDIPARYVTGYLLADDTGAAHEAGHAWAELHVDGYGWIGFDPANRRCPTDHYVRLACGVDALDAAPIRGAAAGGREASLEVEVSVSAISDGA